jgi:hypothetical protein
MTVQGQGWTTTTPTSGSVTLSLSSGSAETRLGRLFSRLGLTGKVAADSTVDQFVDLGHAWCALLLGLMGGVIGRRFRGGDDRGAVALAEVGSPPHPLDAPG